MGRLRSLDGLRGLASLAVLLAHIMYTSNVFAHAALRSERVPEVGSWQWLLTHTPLHLFWDGTAAVAIFFVLSGVVLTLPVLRAKEKFAWKVYYPKRILRLYLPVWAVVALGTLLAVLVPRMSDPALGSWLTSRPDPMPLGVVKDLILITGPSDVISPLWTLQWEVLFSLLLPAYIAFVVLLPKWWAAKVVGVFILITAGALTMTESVVYMGTFAVGCLLAAFLPKIAAIAAGIGPRVWLMLGVGVALLLTAKWFVMSLDGSDQLLAGARVVVVAGAAAAVLLAAFWPSAIRLLESRPIAWLGTISFSLYLVHEPILLATSYLLGSPFSWIAGPVSLAIAAVFYRFIERPSHRLSIAVGKRIAQRSTVTVDRA